MREPMQDDFDKDGDAQLRDLMARLMADLNEVPTPARILELAHQLQTLIDQKTRDQANTDP